MMRFTVVRAMQSYYIGIFQEVVKASIPEIKLFCQLFIFENIIRNYFHLKAIGHPYYMLSYAANPNNAQSFSPQVSAPQACLGKVKPSCALPCLVYFPGQI